ncbi:MAG: DUF1573 domain-containing protein [Planctomycetaceae bacterium]|nr:DUF1573 domain-containing protein [Planctomycetaceae bacterium]
MISTKLVDFEVIATGSEAKKQIEVKNVYDQPVHIASVGTTCGCSAAALGQNTIGPGESVFVEVQMNTSKFRQRKDSNLVIKFDSPRFVEHRIPITAYIRTDVVFSPGLAQFGEVELGREGTATVNIAYAGRTDWDIVDIRISNPDLKATLAPVSRQGGNVNYKLTVALSPDARQGRLRDLITIVTNDRTNPYVPLMVEGVIVPDIVVTPPTIAVRPLAPGQSTQVRVIVKGKAPFQIEDIDCEGMSDCFKATLDPVAKNLHVVPIEFSAPNRPGKFAEEMFVKITGRPEPLRFQVTGVINN